MKHRIKRIFNKKGLTLVEILVVLLVSSIILAIAMNMMGPVNNLMNSVRSNAQMDMMCDSANEYIRGKIQAAKSLKIYRLTEQNMLPGSGGAVPAVSDVYVIAVLNVKSSASTPEYRLFDFGRVASGDEIMALINESVLNIGNAVDKYAVFNEAFYQDSSYALEILNGDSGKKWLEIHSQCQQIENGRVEIVNQIRALKFKLLNSFASVDYVSDDVPVIEEDDISIEGAPYLIVYKKVDFTAAP